jgi:hypothetical protein
VTSLNGLRADLVLYLGATGWSRIGIGAVGEMWARPDVDWNIPVPHVLTTEDLTWQDIVNRLADADRVDRAEIERRVRLSSIDVANLRAANDYLIADTIPYSAGVAMVTNSWNMFRACATTSLKPRAHIHGQYRVGADEILKSARMAHTRAGSYVIPIYMPLSPPDELDEPVLEFEAPPEAAERRVMRTFAEALATFSRVAVEPEAEPRASEMLQMVAAGVSTEFATSLHRVLSQPAVAEFGASFDWALSGGPPPAVASRIEISAAAAPRVERVAQKLRQQTSKRTVEVLTGPIVEIRRDDDDSGSVVVQTVRNSQQAHVRVNVSRRRLDDALLWMRKRETVVVRGRVRRTSGYLMADRKDAVDLLSSTQLI